MYGLNKYIFRLSLRGMGILNHENDRISGEGRFIKTVLRNQSGKNISIFDVGAFIGEYSTHIKQNSNSKSADVYAFEPMPGNFKKLKEAAEKNNFKAINAACGDVSGTVKFYDYDNENGSQHASLYRDAIEKIHKGSATEIEARIIKLDDFVNEHKDIQRIFLLKIDTEGNEMLVMKGAHNLISRGLIDIIHFEFNEMNVVSRTFFKDFYDLLSPNYKLHRLLPYGMVELDYSEIVFCEIFAFQNLVAMRKGFIY